MKVKNIMFSGFMAAILSMTGASAADAVSVASTGYVDSLIGQNVTEVSFATDDTNYLKTATGLKDAAIALDEQVKLNADAIGLLGGGEGGSVQDLVDKVDDTADAVETLNAGADVKDSVLNKITTAIGGLTGTVNGETGVVKTISQADGRITATRAEIVDADIAADAKIAQSKIDGLTDALGAKADADDVYTKEEATEAFATAAQGALADTALQASDIATGATQGTIKVGETDVAVNGLGSAAYVGADTFETAGAAAAVKDELTAELAGKQVKLTDQNLVGAGSVDVAIAEDGEITITGTDTTYTGTGNVSIDEKNQISVTTGAVAADATTLVTGGAVDSYVTGYALPKPDADCSETTCVLSVDGNGTPQWMKLMLPNS